MAPPRGSLVSGTSVALRRTAPGLRTRARDQPKQQAGRCPGTILMRKARAAAPGAPAKFAARTSATPATCSPPPAVRQPG
eukprot:3098293-Heterocapsa_arctica.AAC.2